MKLLVRTAAVALIGLTAAAANAGITLPTTGTAVRFDGGTMVFDTSIDPIVNGQGQLVAPSGPVQLLAFGDVNHIVNNDSSTPTTGDIGSISADTQVTFALNNAYLDVANADISASPANNANLVKYVISTPVVGLRGLGPTLTVWEKDLNSASGLNTQSYIGTNSGLGIPGAVSTGATKYLEFDNLQNATATIIVKFEKTGGSLTFNKRTILLQSFSVDGFPVTGGTAAPLFTFGQSLTGNQVHAAEVTQVAPNSTVGNDAKFIEGNYALIVDRNIPEPASLAMLAIGGLLIGYRARRQEA